MTGCSEGGETAAQFERYARRVGTGQRCACSLPRRAPTCTARWATSRSPTRWCTRRGVRHGSAVHHHPEAVPPHREEFRERLPVGLRVRIVLTTSPVPRGRSKPRIYVTLRNFPLDADRRGADLVLHVASPALIDDASCDTLMCA